MTDSPNEILRRHSLKPKHAWGQNFLGDEDLLDRLADECMLVAGDVVVELGAGLGHFTRALVATGATVVAVERDRELVAVLQAEGMPGARLVEGNAAELNFAATAGVDEVVVVGNLPYHLTSPILFSVMEQASHVKRAVFTLQKEVVDRVSAEPGSRTYGLLSVLLAQRFHIEHVFDIDRNAFHPPPNVDSAVLRLARRSVPKGPVADEARFRRLVKAGFAQRRKTLSNSLNSDAGLFEQVSVAQVLAQAGIDGKRRAETLSVDEFVLLEQALAALTPT